MDRIDGKIKMIDWGNSYIRNSSIKWITENMYDISEAGFTLVNNSLISAEYWKSVGHEYTSVDLNGKEGALQLDMRLPIRDNDEHNLIDSFDLLTDSGTSEHVSEQYQNWKNQYEVLKEGGYFVHILPKEGYWGTHCEFKYNLEFFEQLAKANDYEMIESFEQLDSDIRCDICCVMRKTSSKGFMTKEQFDELPLFVEPNADQMNDRTLYPYAYKK